MTKEIKESVDKIREECDTIEDNLELEEEDEEEDKNAKTRGDRVCEIW